MAWPMNRRQWFASVLAVVTGASAARRTPAAAAAPPAFRTEPPPVPRATCCCEAVTYTYYSTGSRPTQLGQGQFTLDGYDRPDPT